MTDRPILFSAPMIRAILREIEAPGTGKTQTRRVLKLPVKGIYEHPKMGGWAASTIGGTGCYLDPAHTIPAPERPCVWHQTTGDVILPAVEVGDRLWVRETWAVGNIYDGVAPRDINPYGQPGWCGIRYAASHSRNGIFDRPSIHMPRWASRLTLTVKDVRVQRLHDISEDDAQAEGVELNLNTGAFWGADGQGVGGATRQYATAALAFRDLWDSLNTKPGMGWADNPWVAAISFTARLGNIDSEGV